MKVLLLEQELIVKKDLEMQLKKMGIQVLNDDAESCDFVIVGQLSSLQALREKMCGRILRAKIILFTTSSYVELSKESYGFRKAFAFSKPDQAGALLHYLKSMLI
jgi:hypothetical protein